MWLRLKTWAKALKRDIFALYLAMHDTRVSWYAKILAGVVAGYALSPIDLIPDTIPVLGYLDDIVLLPLGILLVTSLVPPAVMDDLRQKATAEEHNRGHDYYCDMVPACRRSNRAPCRGDFPVITFSAPHQKRGV